MMIDQVEELVQIIDNLKEEDKKTIIKYVWVKYVLGLPNSDTTDNEIIRKIEDVEEKYRKEITNHVYRRYILPRLNFDEDIDDVYDDEDYIYD